MNNAKTSTVFEKHAKKTLVAIVIVTFIGLDFITARMYKFIVGHSWYTERYEAHTITERVFRVSSPVYHHGLAKNISNYNDAKWGYRTYQVSTDSLGFKSQSARDTAIRSDKHRVMFIGDSFTEGIGVEYSSTFVGLVAKGLSKKSIEVLNAGVGGYSPIIYWRKTKYLIEDIRLKFDELIVFIDISDAYDEAISYGLDEDNNVTDRVRKERIISKHSVKENSIFFPWLIKGLRGLSPSYAINQKKSSWTRSSSSLLEYGNNGLRLMEKHMNKLYDLLEERNIKLTVAVYPWPDQIINNDLDCIQVSFWKDWSTKHNVKFLDYFPNFIKPNNTERDNKLILDKYYIPGDIHWNEEGHSLVADAFLSFYLNNSSPKK